MRVFSRSKFPVLSEAFLRFTAARFLLICPNLTQLNIVYRHKRHIIFSGGRMNGQAVLLCVSAIPFSGMSSGTADALFLCPFLHTKEARIMTDTYAADKPKDCRYCYYYSKNSCTLKKCYYILPPKTEPVSECTDCPYGRCAPCIGWCTKEVLRSIGRGCAK